MKKCNGTGLVLKICETKNNEWKRYTLSIQDSIDNCIKTIRIKPNFASLSSGHLTENCRFYAVSRSFFLFCDVNMMLPNSYHPMIEWLYGKHPWHLVRATYQRYYHCLHTITKNSINIEKLGVPAYL